MPRHRIAVALLATLFSAAWFTATDAADPPQAPAKDISSAKVDANDDAAEAAAAAKDEEYYELYKVFSETLFQVEQNYVKDVDRRKLMEAAIRGLVYRGKTNLAAAMGRSSRWLSSS